MSIVFPTTLRGKTSFSGQLDPVSFFLFVLGTVFFALQVLGKEFGLSTPATTGFLLLITGLLGGWFVATFIFQIQQRRTPIYDPRITSVEAMFTLTGSTMVFFGIVISQLLVIRLFHVIPSWIGSSVVTNTMNSVIFAIGEEYFFRYFLTTVFINLFGAGVGIFSSSVIWTGFHAYRYPPEALFVVLVGGFLIGTGYYLARGRLTAAIIPHVLINLIAVSPLFGGS